MTFTGKGSLIIQNCIFHMVDKEDGYGINMNNKNKDDLQVCILNCVFRGSKMTLWEHICH